MTNPIADPFVGNPDVSPTSGLVRLEATADGAVTVVMNRAARRNAWDAEMISALAEAFRTLAGAEGVRVAFVRGAGGTFASGGDVEGIRRSQTQAEDELREDLLAFGHMLKAWHDLPQLTVALVEGLAIGGAAALAAASDLAVATADAQFCFPEAKLGIVPGAIAPFVVRAVGPRRARSLFATGRMFDAAHAERIGLIDEVVPDAAALDVAAGRIADEVMACAPGAVAEAKRLVDDVYGRPIDDRLLADCARRNAAGRLSDEGQAGVLAFLEKRPPPWADRG
jgi:methylglutaconyl-CoA hydratase